MADDYDYEEPRETLGRRVQLEFWQINWMCLLSFIFLSTNVEVIDMLSTVSCLLMLAGYLLVFPARIESLNRPLTEWLPIGLGFPLLPFILEKRRDGPWDAVLVPSSVTYLILLHFLIVPGHNSRYSRFQRIVGVSFCHMKMMAGTFDLLEYAGDLVEPEYVIVYFKTTAVATFAFAGCFFDPDLTAALAARFRCTTGVCPGLTIRRRAILLVHFLIFLLPLALGTVWLLMKLKIASNDTIATTMDRLLPALCLAFFISHISEAIRN